MRVFVHENENGLRDRFLQQYDDLEGGVASTEDTTIADTQSSQLNVDQTTKFTCGICYDDFDLTT